MGKVNRPRRAIDVHECASIMVMMDSLKFPLAVSLLAALAYAYCTWFFAHDLPDHVATHFDATGRANGWMTRSGSIAFELALGLGVQVFIALMCWLARYLAPARVNIPHKQYWHQPEHFPRACAMIFRHSLWLGSLIVVWLILLNYQVRQANLAVPAHLSPGGFVFAMGTFLVVLLWWIIALLHLFRVPTPR